ncbi:MAG: TonB-dependent receptor [Caulobacterales bacterium]
MSQKKAFGWALFTGVSMAAMSLVSPALAQDDPGNDDEIVVTATGRAAVLQEVPIAVTALNAAQLENAGVQDIRDVAVLTPSYRFFTGQSNSAGTTASIRGVGTGGDNPGFESAVGFFIDGVYRNRSGVALTELPEVQRIEVLRGPQGTLFGRNTTSGAISVVTAGPEFTTRAFGEIEAGNFGYLSATGGITGPLADNFAVRMEGNIQARDGYITDVNTGRDINDRNRWFVRGQALWDITSDASLRIIVDTAQTDENCCTAISVKQGAAAGAINLIAGLQGRVGMVAPITDGGYNVALSPNRSYGEAVEEWGWSGQLDWAIGDLNLTSITAYRDWSAERDQDIDFSGIDRAYRDGYDLGFQTFTQELRLQGENGPLNWIVGGFYADESLDLTDTIRFGADSARYVDALTAGVDLNGPAPGGTGFTLFRSLNPAAPLLVETIALLGGVPPLSAAALGNGLLAAAPTAGQGQQADNWATETTSWSLFTHNEISLSDQLTWTVGVRYNHEEKDMTGSLNSVVPACNFLNSLIDTPSEAIVSAMGALRILVCNPAINTQSNGNYRDSTEENEWSGTTNLRYQFTDDFMVYGSYSRGYKAGGFNLDRSGFSYSLGLLSNAVVPNTNQLQFAPEFVDAYELGFKSTLFDGRATFNGTVYYQQITDYQLNAFSGFNFIVFNVPEAITQGVELDMSLRATDNLTFTGAVAYNDATYESTLVDSLGITQVVAGSKFTTPEWNVSGSALYEVPLSDNYTAKFYLNGTWVSEYATQTLSRDPVTDNDAFATFNARIGLANASGWELELWGENISDEYYYIGSFAVPEQTGNFAVYPSVPRTWGVTLRADF